MRVVELHITDISKEGYGHTQWTNPQGLCSQVEVPFTAPGDHVTVELGKKRKSSFQGKLLVLNTPSNQRIEALCAHFGACGGCRWQHLPYAQQLELKSEKIRTLLTPYLHAQTVWYPILACSPPWEYRNKMELSFSSDKANNRYLGLILQGSRGRVFQMKECHLVNKWYVDAVNAVSYWWEKSGLEAYHLHRNTGSLRTLILREGQRSGDRLVMLTVSGNPDYALKKQQIDEFVACLKAAITPLQAEARLCIFLRIQQIAKGHPTHFYEMVLSGPDHIRETLHLRVEGVNTADYAAPFITSSQESAERKGVDVKDRNEGIALAIAEERSLTDAPLQRAGLSDEIMKVADYSMKFRVSPGAFFQPNTRQAEQLYSRALSLAQLTPQATVYDLYCGTGTLGLCAARHAKEVIGIEINPDSVVDARENVKINQVSNFSIRKGDVGAILAELKKENRPSPDVVFVDPPRVGLDAQALRHLIELKAARIVYISCNPLTQAANLETLIQEGGYVLEAVQPVDQFPQTIHVENIVVLNRKINP